MGMDFHNSVRMLLQYYRELGFDRLPVRGLSILKDEAKQGPGIAAVAEGGKDRRPVPINSQSAFVKEAALETLSGEIGDCRRCKLSSGRKNIVFGEGNADAPVMFIGEAPGREEDLQGRPFVGEAGQLLTRLIERMGFKREDVYIANIIKCRPPMNRDPQEDEMRTCSPFLAKQVEIISPRVIVSLGKISAYTLLNIDGPMSKFSITRTRGKFYEYKGVPLMPTFHPAYLLRNPKDKWLTWEDAQSVLKKLKGQ